MTADIEREYSLRQERELPTEVAVYVGSHREFENFAPVIRAFNKKSSQRNRAVWNLGTSFHYDLDGKASFEGDVNKVSNGPKVDMHRANGERYEFQFLEPEPRFPNQRRLVITFTHRPHGSYFDLFNRVVQNIQKSTRNFIADYDNVSSTISVITLYDGSTEAKSIITDASETRSAANLKFVQTLLRKIPAAQPRYLPMAYENQRTREADFEDKALENPDHGSNPSLTPVSEPAFQH